MGNEHGSTGEAHQHGDKYVCDACGKQFDDENELRKHVREVGQVE